MSDDERAAWLLIAAPALVFVVLLVEALRAVAWAVLVLAEWAGVAS